MIPGFIEVTGNTGDRVLIPIDGIIVYSVGDKKRKTFIRVGTNQIGNFSESYDQVKAMIAEQCKPMLITDSFPHIKED